MFQFKPFAFLPEIGLKTQAKSLKAGRAPVSRCGALPYTTKARAECDRARSTAASFERCFRLDSGCVSKEQIRGQLGQLKQKLNCSAVFNESFSVEMADSRQYMAELRALGVNQ